MMENRASILIVDDEELIRDLFRRHLTQAGYVVSTAASGSECLEKLRRERYDLLLLDIRMPDADGLEVLQQIRADSHQDDMPVIMLTATRGKSVVEKALDLGANDYLIKPCNWPLVRQRLARLLAARHDTVSIESEKDLISNAKVLVVDDDDLSRDLLARRIQSFGYQPRVARSGEEGLLLLSQDHPDLMLLDMQMPGMDGLTVLRKIKSDPQLADIPVIIISAVDDSDSMVSMLVAGAEDYVTKPYHAVILAKRVHSCLVAKRRQDRQRARQKRLQELAELGEQIRSLPNFD